MPADNNLRRGFAVFICQIANDFLIETPVLALMGLQPLMDFVCRVPGV